MACAYLHWEIKMVSDSTKVLRIAVFGIKYFLGNHSVIHSMSCKRVHEFAIDHYECDSGNAIWKKTRLGFGILTKIRIASEIRLPVNPLPSPSFQWPPFNRRRRAGGRWYPCLKGPFLQSFASAKSVLSLYESNYCTSVLLPLWSCCFVLFGFLPWSFLVVTCLTFTLELSCHKFHPGWRQIKGPLSKEASGTLQFFSKRVSKRILFL